MKIVDARLSTGEVIQITEEWFVNIAERPHADWREVMPVLATFSGAMEAKINPKYIVWLRVLGREDDDDGC